MKSLMCNIWKSISLKSRLENTIAIFLLLGCVTMPETGRKVFILTSESQEKKLGADAYHEILKKEKLSQNSRLIGILERVGQRIKEASRQPNFSWEFKLIESAQKNAFCLPGGKVAVYTGILSICENEAGLATVIGHEVAHATLRHSGQRISVAFGTQLGLQALSKVMGQQNSQNKKLVLQALGLGVTVGAILPFSRSHESEADEVGLIYMARAGYDPLEAPRFWDRFSSSKDGSGPPAFLSTHPGGQDRKKALEAKMSSVLPEYDRSNKFGLGENLASQ